MRTSNKMTWLNQYHHHHLIYREKSQSQIQPINGPSDALAFLLGHLCILWLFVTDAPTGTKLIAAFRSTKPLCGDPAYAHQRAVQRRLWYCIYSAWKRCGDMRRNKEENAYLPNAIIAIVYFAYHKCWNLRRNHAYFVISDVALAATQWSGCSRWAPGEYYFHKAEKRNRHTDNHRPVNEINRRAGENSQLMILYLPALVKWWNPELWHRNGTSRLHAAGILCMPWGWLLLWGMLLAMRLLCEQPFAALWAWACCCIRLSVTWGKI